MVRYPESPCKAWIGGGISVLDIVGTSRAKQVLYKNTGRPASGPEVDIVDDTGTSWSRNPLCIFTILVTQSELDRRSSNGFLLDWEAHGDVDVAILFAIFSASSPVHLAMSINDNASIIDFGGAMSGYWSSDVYLESRQCPWGRTQLMVSMGSMMNLPSSVSGYSCRCMTEPRRPYPLDHQGRDVDRWARSRR